jgi:sugar O-acyltransferase (sialic acid O-acetyltransferase NeuD family)
MTEEIIIVGASGFGREVAWLVEQMAESSETGPRVVCFADDDASRSGTQLNGYEIKLLDAARRDHPLAALVIGVGNPRARREIAARAAANGCSFVTLVHPRVERSRWIEIGEGTVICAGSMLTTNIRLGRHVQINLDCTIGHDAVLEDFVTLAPGVHVSGQVRLEAGAYVGTGAAIINGREGAPLIIGAGATVGAAACVIEDVPPGDTVVGVPARGRRI